MRSSAAPSATVSGPPAAASSPTTPNAHAETRTAPAAARALTPQAAEVVAAALAALADPLRVRIVSVVATSPAGEASAGEIASVAAVTAPTVSHHLKVLTAAGVLSVERRGTWRFYSVAPHAADAVLPLLEALAARPRRDAVGTRADDDAAGHDAAARHRLADQATLDDSAATLAGEFADLPADVITHTLRESYASLLRTARPGVDPAALAVRFARERLADLAWATARDNAEPRDARPRVLFVCVANAGRSQLAAALVRRYAGDAVVVRSAGTRPAQDVHAAVRPLLAELLGTDALDELAFPKPLTDDAVRAADVVITLGCGDACPVVPGTRYEDWAVGDPALASPEGTRAIRDDLDARVRALLAYLLPGHPRAVVRLDAVGATPSGTDVPSA